MTEHASLTTNDAVSDLTSLPLLDARRPQRGDEVVLLSGANIGFVTDCRLDRFKVLVGGKAGWLRIESVQARKMGVVRLNCDQQSMADYAMGGDLAAR